MKKNYILGIGLTNAKKEEILEFIITSLKERRKKLAIFTPNPEIIMHANKHNDFKKVLNRADLALADGVGVIFAGRLLGKPFKDRITGVDFMLELCRRAAKEGFTVGLMGGGPKIAERTAECLWRRYPKLKIVFAGPDWPRDLDRVSKAKIEDRRWKLDRKNLNHPASSFNNLSSSFYPPSSNSDILFVAFGFPKQERWIYENLPKIPVRVAMAIGGAFDYISGAVPRAPKFLRNLGLEWLFRLLIQPWRLRRQLSLVQFILLVLREKIRRE